MNDDDCRTKFIEELRTGFQGIFSVLFITAGVMGVMMYLTQACVMNFYHGSNGSLKDTIQGITSHGKQLPQEQKRKLLASKRPEALSAAEREKAILELSDDEDNKEPTDPEAAQLLLDGDEALHEGDLDIALRFYLKGQAIEHDNPQLKSRVKHARYQKSLEREQQQQQALYDQEQLDDEQPFETENPTAK